MTVGVCGTPCGTPCGNGTQEVSVVLVRTGNETIINKSVTPSGGELWSVVVVTSISQYQQNHVVMAETVQIHNSLVPTHVYTCNAL